MTTSAAAVREPDLRRPAGVWKHVSADQAGLAGLLIVVLFGTLALAAALGWAGHDWAGTRGESWQPPSTEHWFGTNRVGQDIFARAIYSTRTAFEIGVSVAVASTLLGAVLGGVAGWFSHRWPDEVILWAQGVLDSIPFYLFVAAVAFAMRGNPWAMHIAMVATFWTGTGRLVRGEVMRLRQRDFVAAARAIGLPGLIILFRHILPNTVHILLVQATLVFVAAIKTEVILSFLGLGTQDGISWGVMLAESTQEVLAGQFGNFLAASAFLFLLLLGFNLLSDALQDAFDMRGSDT